MDKVKVFGEVNTPAPLRRDLLDCLGARFWNRPRLVFEPCCGKSGFVMDCIRALMRYMPFAGSEPDKLQFIVEECLFWADLNPENVAYTARRIYSHPAADPRRQYAFNAFVGDSLRMDLESAFPSLGRRRFDAVITNPPFQTRQTGRRRGGYGGKTLWDQFVYQALEAWCDRAVCSCAFTRAVGANRCIRCGLC